MIVWLDFALFGNGRGLKEPFFDGVFYWMRGEFYTWQGWAGSQLSSFQWFHPKAQERRKLNGREYAPYQSHRTGPRVRVSWRLVDLPKDIDASNAMLRTVAAELAKMEPYRPDRPTVIQKGSADQ